MADVYDAGHHDGAHHPFFLRIFYRYLYETQTYRDDGISIHRLCRNYFLKHEKKQVLAQQPDYFEHMDENGAAPGLS